MSTGLHAFVRKTCISGVSIGQGGERQVPDNKCGSGSRKAALTINASNPDPDIREMLSKGLLKE